jgi:hypothetical protein
MSATAWPDNSLADFYQRQLLPTAFERLDQLDPSSSWKTAHFGWRGASGDRARTSFQPWGFVDAGGGAHSWLSSFHGRLPMSAGEFLEAVDRLAQLLGLEDALDVQRVPPYELFAAYLQFRQDSLFETFLGLSQHGLASTAGTATREALAERFGVDDAEIASWPLGVYPEPKELFARLKATGFTADEIGWSAVLGDQRLPGRLLVPWRDRWGRLSTVVARDLQAPATAPGRQLLLPAGTRAQVFGLDVALRAENGPQPHVFVAEGLLEVVALQARGVRNVCSAGRVGAPLSDAFWLELGSSGVRQATVLLRQTAGRSDREFSGVGAAAALLPAPQVWVFPTRTDAIKELAGTKPLANVMAKRQPGFKVAAEYLVEQHPALDRQDTQLELLKAAVSFDEQVRDPERQVELESQFWPVIERALGEHWPRLRQVREIATNSLEHRQDRASRVRLYQRVLADLSILLDGLDVEGFEKRMREALGLADVAMPQKAPPLTVSGWEVIELKPVPPTPMSVSRPAAKPEAIESAAPIPAPIAPIAKKAEAPVSTVKPAPSVKVEEEIIPAKPALASMPPMPRSPRIMPRTVNGEDIRFRAYCLWEKHGRPEGREVFFWAMAERELRGEASALLASQTPPVLPGR